MTICDVAQEIITILELDKSATNKLILENALNQVYQDGFSSGWTAAVKR